MFHKNSFVVVLVVMTAIVIKRVESFAIITNKRAKSTTNMMAFGLEKLGQPIIKVENPGVVPSTEPSLFGYRAALFNTNGNDERDDSSPDDRYHDELFSLDMNFQKKRLLAGLSNGDWSQQEKLDRIRVASTQDGTIESLSMVASLSSGGLFQEWDFDF